MGVLIQIGLIFWAWKRGWRWRALIPFGACFVIGFFYGMANPELAGTDLSGNPFAVFIGVAALIANIIMIIKKPAAVAAEPPAKKK